MIPHLQGARRRSTARRARTGGLLHSTAVTAAPLKGHLRTLAHGARLYPPREAIMSESGAPLVVRAALVADAPSIAAIGSVAFPAVHNDVVGAEFAAAVVEQTYSLEALTACIARCTAADDAEFLVAERDGEVIGYLHYDSEGAEPELHRIYVDPDKKRGGVGRALMQELHARLKPGAQYILL